MKGGGTWVLFCAKTLRSWEALQQQHFAHTTIIITKQMDVNRHKEINIACNMSHIGFSS
jgi:hypothetical protein